MGSHNMWPLVSASCTEHNAFKGHREVAGGGASFFFVAESYSSVWVDHILSIGSRGDGHLRCSNHLAVYDDVTVNICEQFCVDIYI